MPDTNNQKPAKHKTRRAKTQSDEAKGVKQGRPAARHRRKELKDSGNISTMFQGQALAAANSATFSLPQPDSKTLTPMGGISMDSRTLKQTSRSLSQKFTGADDGNVSNTQMDQHAISTLAYGLSDLTGRSLSLVPKTARTAVAWPRVILSKFMKKEKEAEKPVQPRSKEAEKNDEDVYEF